MFALHRLSTARFAWIAGAALLLSACSGGGDGGTVAGIRTQPTAAPGTGQSSSRTFVLSGTVDGGGPQLFTKAKAGRYFGHQRRASNSFSSISVTGTLYQGDVNASPISNTISISPPSGSTYSASVPFSNVTAHANEWAVLSFTGVASNGSRIALGQLAGLVNTTSSSANTATLTAATTQRFQVFVTLASAGVISTYDLTNDTNIDSKLQSEISSAGGTPDPNTQVFDAAELVTLFNAIEPQWLRTIKVTTSPAGPNTVVVETDYTQAAELITQANLENYLAIAGLAGAEESLGYGSAYGVSQYASLFSANVIGGPSCGGIDLPTYAGYVQIPASGVLIPSIVNACFVPNPTGTVTIAAAYGGYLKVGATNNAALLELQAEDVARKAGHGAHLRPATTPSAAPFLGAWTALTGENTGTTTNVSLSLTSSATSITVSDPWGFAFFPDGGLELADTDGPSQGFSVAPDFGNEPLSQTSFTTSTVLATEPVTVPEPYKSGATLTVDKFSFWDIAGTDLALCTVAVTPCFNLHATQPFVVSRFFNDPGTDLGYYDWKPSGVATKVALTSGGGSYTVTTSGSGTATVTTTTETAFLPQQAFDIATSLETAGVVTIKATDENGNTYTNSALVAPFADAMIEMYSVGAETTMKQVAISFPSTGSGSFTFGPVESSTIEEALFKARP